MVMAPLWFALALAAPADALTAGPVTVEIVTVGKVETPGQHFVLPIRLSVTAATQKQADALLAERRQALIAKVTAAGGTLLPENRDVMSEPLNTFDIADAASEKSASANISVVASDPAMAKRVRDAVAATPGASLMSPQVTLLDPASARPAAIAAGMKQARDEAAVYAAALGLPKITMVSISEKSDLGALMLMTGIEGRGPLFARGADGDNVVTVVPVIVTYRLER